MQKLLMTAVVVAFAVSAAAEDRRARVFEAKQHAGGELRYINNTPVLILRGTPAQMGEQAGTLTRPNIAKVLQFPKEMLKRVRIRFNYDQIVKTLQQYRKQAPKHLLAELDALAKASGVTAAEVFAGNLLPDVSRAFGCSSLMVDGNRSATGGPLFGRNLDYFNLADIHTQSLITVYHPKGKRAFASVGFPGLVGVLSGMNEAGLSIAVHEVYRSKDKSPKFNPEGVPYTMLFRRILEECATIDEAVKLLKASKRTTMLNLGISDAKQQAVIEISPRSVQVRYAEAGVCRCTNHFRTEAMAVNKQCWRYSAMGKDLPKKVTVSEIARRLDIANQGRLTLHTMVFEPKSRRLHISMGRVPSSKFKMNTINLGDLFPKPRGKKK